MTEKKPTDEDAKRKRLRYLARELDSMATSARTWAERGKIDGVRREIERCESALRAWSGLNPAAVAPYLDARMLLTESVLRMALMVKRTTERAKTKSAKAAAAVANRRRAETIAFTVADHYPMLGAKILEPARINAVAVALTVAARRKSAPWRELATAWRGIEAERTNEAKCWKADWERWRAKEH